MIELHDGHAEPGDTCYHVTARGVVVPFGLVRCDIFDQTGFHPIPVLVAVSGLYCPHSCYVTERNAEEEGRRRKSARRRLAERDLAELAELGGES